MTETEQELTVTTDSTDRARPDDQNDTAAMMAAADRKARDDRPEPEGTVSEGPNSFSDAETSGGGADALPDAHG